MKRLLTLLILFVAVLQLSAQAPAKTYGSRRPLWVGLDMGGTWQASDMKAQGGIGWSFTLSRYSKLDKTGPLYFGWRFRFLDGRDYGYNYHRLYGLDADPTLSTPGSLTDYHTPTTNNDGYVFSNYKFRFDEFAYEVIVGSNGLRKHGVLLYGFGGIGADHWKTTTNQLNEFNEQYDYSGISTSGNVDDVKQDLKFLWLNGNYETVANGSSSSGKWGIMPSAGFGLGYQFGNAVALGVEHRTTWALNDNIDGVNHNSAGASTGGNDLYNYDGFFVRWTFGGGSHSDSHTDNTDNRPANPNNYSNNPPPNNNPPTNNTTTVVAPNNPPNNPGNYNPPPSGIPPYVSFTTPSVDPYTATNPVQQLVVRVEHVANASQISLMINNQVSYNFSFNPNTNTMVFTHNLQNGTNTYQVSASNQFGNASDVQTIYYGSTVNNNPPSALPPQVTITNPATDPYTSLVASMNVTATVLNVTTAANVQVRRNGVAMNNFTFDPNMHQVTFTANLSTGANMYEVIGTNTVGSASDNVTINYNPVAAIQPPVVTITNPSTCPYSVKLSAFTINATITNVTTASQVSIIFDGSPVTQFNFVNNGTSATVSFPVTLISGSNPFSITGTNAGGSNTKSCEIILKTTAPPAAVPPTVIITDPGSSIYISPIPTHTVLATVLNVASQNEITVTSASGSMNGWTYNMTTHILTLPVNLNVGSNVYTVTASNANGSDSKSTTIIYNVAPPTVGPPTVGFIIPASDPYATNTTPFNVVAGVTNITAANQIVLHDQNGQNVPFSFNASSLQVSFTANLVVGSNLYTITVTNSVGSATADETIRLIVPHGGGNAPDPGSGGGSGSGNGGGDNGTSPNSSGGHTPIGGNQPPAPEGVSVSLVDPATSSVNITSSQLAISMRVNGVNAPGEITVHVNGVVQTNVTYNTQTHIVSFTATLVNGANTVQVSASNANGNGSQTLNITATTSSRGGSPNQLSNPGGGNRSSGGSSSGPRTTTTTTSSGSTTSTVKPESKPTTTTTTTSTTTAPEKPANTSGGRGTTTTAPAKPR
jgi:hypothetical protein